MVSRREPETFPAARPFRLPECRGPGIPPRARRPDRTDARDAPPLALAPALAPAPSLAPTPAAGALFALALLLAGLIWIAPAGRTLWDRVDPGPPSAQGYPGPSPSPAPPSPTPPPDPAGRFPPPAGLPLEIVPRGSGPFAPLLDALQTALDARDAAALAARVDLARGGLRLAAYSESEGGGARLDLGALEGLLARFLAAEPAPVVQGYFQPGCASHGTAPHGTTPYGATPHGTVPTCTLFVLVTGGPDRVTPPPPPIEDGYGPPAPASWPLAAAAWELAPDGGGGAWWRAWYPGEGYHALAEALAARRLGLYRVWR